MRWLIIVLIALLLGLQYRLWYGEGGLREQSRLQRLVEQQVQRNTQLQERNQALADDVAELKTGTLGIEERAREDLGMIKEGETFYMILEDKTDSKEPTPLGASGQ